MIGIAVSTIAQNQFDNSVLRDSREARKARMLGKADLDRNGRLDRAERALLRTELKSKMDPVKKRIISTNQPPIAPR
jgi:hypothetical protein